MGNDNEVHGDDDDDGDEVAEVDEVDEVNSDDNYFCWTVGKTPIDDFFCDLVYNLLPIDQKTLVYWISS